MKIVITDHRFPNIDHERRSVEMEGWQLVEGHVTQEEEVAELCRDADAVLSVRAPISRRVIAGMERCQVIVRYGIGVETVDISAASERGIMVANVPDYCVDEVSDHALTLLLMLSRQAVPATRLAREPTWSTSSMPRLHRLRDQYCGLFGAGKIGSLLASKLKSLGMKIIVYDPYLPKDQARETGMTKVSLEELLQSSDYISLHAPLTAETTHVFTHSTFARMKRSAFLINTARGGLVDEIALLSAIDDGQVAGAALDVLESETAVTPVRSALVAHPKVIVTAHTGWLSEEARDALQVKAIDQIISSLKGTKPYGLINKELTRLRVVGN
jgi:D-3-phosphoglycerate dehydrogenase